MDRRDFLFAGIATAPATLLTGSSRSFAEDFELMWTRTWTYTLEFADAMPAEHYGFRPTPEIRSFAEQLVHIAQGNFTWAGTIGGSPVAPGTDPATLGEDPDRIRGFMDESFDVMLQAVLAKTDEELDRRVPWARRLGGLRSHSLRGVALTAWHHTAHQRGQCVIYLRLKGITPPGYVD